MSIYFNLVPESKVTFLIKKYRLSGAIFHRNETALKSHYTVAV